jgi:hypothetical protein
VIAAALVLAAAIAAAVLWGGGRANRQAQGQHPARQKTYAELAAANYKTLSPKQTRRLLRFAEAFHACMAKRLDLGQPQTSPTRIVMDLPAGVGLHTAVRLGIACGTKLGDPPPGASLQTRKHVIVLYLPKYCILDRKVVAGSGTTRAGSATS